MQFQSHAEKDFWECVFLAAVAENAAAVAEQRADSAVTMRRARMVEINAKKNPEPVVNA